MRVDIEKRHIDSYERIVREANKAIRRATSKVKKSKYQKTLLGKNISAENKKKKLVKNLHELIISTFSIDINKKIKVDNLKANIELIRYIIRKIDDINNYLEEALLLEIGIIKKSSIVKAVKSSNPEKYLEKQGRVLSKDYINKIEQTVYELIQRIVFFDRKLLKKYTKREIKVIKTEKVDIKDLESILKIESELLDALEAKIPPPSKIKARLFKKDIFNKWVPMMFALLSNFETEYQKEGIIFSEIKKNDKLRKKIENKIKHVIIEKEKLLKIKEKRALEMKGLGKIGDDYRQTFLITSLSGSDSNLTLFLMS